MSDRERVFFFELAIRLPAQNGTQESENPERAT